MRRLAAAVCLLGLAAAGAWADEKDALIEMGREYFDPNNQDKWLARKRFREALERRDAAERRPLLADLPALRDVLYQVRGFEADFADRRWQEENAVLSLTTNGPYTTLLSERARFTYVLPRTHSKEQTTRRRGFRWPPFPLLLVLHEAADDGERTSEAGEAALERWWPKDAFGSVHEGWMMLAPYATRGRFVEEDGTVRTVLTTEVFAQFWKRHHVDFERVVLDGSDAALALAAAQPVFFAGLILRGGGVDPAVVPNFASVPVYVVGDAGLRDGLVAAGHPNVSVGPASDLPTWMAKLRRTTPTRFSWRMTRPDQLLAHWVAIDVPSPHEPERGLSVEVDRDRNLVSIEAEGVAEISVYLNDEIVDLGREVEVVVNGHPERKQVLERSFDQMFDKDPIRIRRSMYLGWLYPVALSKIPVRPREEPPVARDAKPPVAGDAKPPVAGDAKPPVAGDSLSLLLIRGRPEAMAAAPEERDADALLPIGVRDLWWRPDPRADRARYEALAGDGSLTGRRWRWLLEGAKGGYPAAAVPGEEPDRVLTALVTDRLRRDRTGHEETVESSPLRALSDDPRIREEVDRFLEYWMASTYQGPEIGGDPEAAERLGAARSRNRLLALAAVLLFVGLGAGAAVLLGSRA